MASDRHEYNKQYYLKNLEKERQRKRAYYQANKEKIKNDEANKERHRVYYLANRHKWLKTPEQKLHANALDRKRRAESEEARKAHREEVRKWQRENPEKVKRAYHLREYGLSLVEFSNLFEAQDGKCAICEYSDTSNPRMFPVIDHCHTNKHVRGILCANCNHGIGNFKDNPKLLRKAAKYLEDNNTCGPNIQIGSSGRKRCSRRP